MGGGLAHAAVHLEDGGGVRHEDAARFLEVVGVDAEARFDEPDLVRMDGGFAEQPLQEVEFDFLGQHLRVVDAFANGSGQTEAEGNELANRIGPS